MTGFSLWIEINLALVGIEIGLFYVRGSELTWFLCGGRKWLGFSVSIEIDLAYVGGRTRLDVSAGIEINLVLVCVRNQLGFSVCSKSTWF